MPSIVERISYVIDVSAQRAGVEVDRFKTQLQGAETTGQKLRATVGSIGSAVTANLGLSLAAGATVVTGFAQRAIENFTKVALAAGRTAGATGQTVEEASRWNDVAGDLGVSQEALVGAMNRLNKSAAAGTFKSLGIDAGDASTRFLQALGYLRSITDETVRAEEATKLFGRGGLQNLGPLIDVYDSLEGRLMAVGGAQLVTADKLQQARAYAEAVDNMSDSLSKFGDGIARTVLPVLTPFVAALGEITGGLGDLLGMGTKSTQPKDKTNMPWWQQVLSDAGFAENDPRLQGLGVEGLNQLARSVQRRENMRTAKVGQPLPIDENGPAWFTGPKNLATGMTTINVTLPPGLDPNKVQDALRSYARNNGTTSAGSVK